MTKSAITLIFAVLLGAFGCTNEQTLEHQFESMISTPYRASDEKIQLVKDSINRLSIGDNKDTVISILGLPDEVRPIYHRNDKFYVFQKPKPIGESFWYILARDKEKGSFAEKNESLLRISFTLDGIVTNVDKWGRDFP